MGRSKLLPDLCQQHLLDTQHGDPQGGRRHRHANSGGAGLDHEKSGGEKGGDRQVNIDVSNHFSTIIL